MCRHSRLPRRMLLCILMQGFLLFSKAAGQLKLTFRFLELKLFYHFVSSLVVKQAEESARRWLSWQGSKGHILESAVMIWVQLFNYLYRHACCKYVPPAVNLLHVLGKQLLQHYNQKHLKVAFDSGKTLVCAVSANICFPNLSLLMLACFKKQKVY